MQQCPVKLKISLFDLDFTIEGPEPLARDTWDYVSKEIIPHLLGKPPLTNVENEGETEREQPVVNTRREIPEHEETKIENLKENLDGQLRETYNKKRPKTKVATATFFAYYLKHFKNKPEFSQKDLRLCYKSLNLPLSATYPRKYGMQSINTIL